MSDIVTLLFDEYTRDLRTSELKTESQDAKIRYQQLRELVGDAEAIEIWDIAVGEGAAMQEACFQAGLKTGIALALELFPR